MDRGVEWREGGGVGRGGEAEFDNYFVLFILSQKMPFFGCGA